jgi:hypothetical protein
MASTKVLTLLMAVQNACVVCWIPQMQEQILPMTLSHARWKVPFAEAKTGLKAMKNDCIKWSTELQRAALRFVYVKNIFEISVTIPNPDMRKMIISTLIEPPGFGREDYGRIARNRLFRLLCPESDVGNNNIPSNVMSYSSFLRALNVWIEPGAYVVLDDETGKWRLQVRQRVQESGLCYMHAPVVLQSYLLSWSFRNAESSRACEMLDMRRYILENFSSTQLYNHIVSDEGGNSLDYLKNILIKGSKMFHVSSTDVINAALIQQYGPALIYQFKVYEDFKEPGRLSYLEEPTGECAGRHSMVLIGVREEGSRKVFLLQNWWKRKQFVEVSDTYLSACDARIAFVRTPQTGLSDLLQSRYTVYAETMDLDKMDSLCPERRSGLDP